MCALGCLWHIYNYIYHHTVQVAMVVNARAADEFYGKRDAAYTVPKFQHYSMEV